MKKVLTRGEAGFFPVLAKQDFHSVFPGQNQIQQETSAANKVRLKSNILSLLVGWREVMFPELCVHNTPVS